MNMAAAWRTGPATLRGDRSAGHCYAAEPRRLRLNPSLHNAQGMMLDEGSIPVHEYIVGRLNDYDLAYSI
jgi:hypothetical protein